ncbi:MAG: YbaN family protein [Bacteroidales bacterium]|nr:YbaN family protein [Bacteroidales bacterium]
MDKDYPEKPSLIQNKVLRIIVLLGGFVFTFLAGLGAILPLLPTTPFLIVAAACFHKSSPRFYRLIMNNRFFGHYLRDYQSGKGISPRVKIAALTFLWVTSIVSVFLFIPYLWFKILVIAMAMGVTVHIYMIKTKKGT